MLVGSMIIWPCRCTGIFKKERLQPARVAFHSKVSIVMVSHFFAYLSKLRWIRRWGLKRNAIDENVMEHSWEVATIAHALALLHNRRCGGQVDANAVAAAALFHDATEVFTGDMPSPVKYHNPAITQAYKALERRAERDLLALLPSDLQADYQALLLEERVPEQHRIFIKAADILAAYIKCEAELRAGNIEFTDAAEDIRARLQELEMPEVRYFIATFLPSYDLTLDQLLTTKNPPLWPGGESRSSPNDR